MNCGCPNSECKYHQKSDYVIKDGTYFRKNDSRYIQRLKCSYCNKKFSYSTHSLAYRHKKRRVSYKIYRLYSSGMSIRRIAKELRIHQTTVQRKIIYLAKLAKLKQEKLLYRLSQSPIKHIQIDDLITSEHTKMKPLSVSAIIDAKTRMILGLRVSQIPAFGHLAKKSVEKYGYRKSSHFQNFDELMKKVAPSVDANVLIQSDEHKSYPPLIKKHFPNANHEQFKGEKGAISGQGELKKIVYDPLFSINHTFAMLRANINRLFRRTWNTTKDPQMLQRHLDIYQMYHNQELI